ncbi:MAG: nucleotidyltransferase family protein [Cyanobacteria bacterium P01_F01_bin.143]
MTRKMLVNNIEIPSAQINEFCQRWKVQELALFGSVLREDFRPDSDIDVLISFTPDNFWTLFDRVDMKDELTEIFGRKVDLVNKKGLERSQNYLRKNNILSSTKVIYEIARY